MRFDNLNWYDHCGYAEMTAPSSNVNVTDEDKSKQIIVHKTLSENSSMGVSESERNIVNETVPQKHSMDVSQYNTAELKEEEHKEPSATKEVKSYFNILKCGRNLLDWLDVTYQRALMATPQYEYYKEMLKNRIKVNNHKGEPLSNENLQQ